MAEIATLNELAVQQAFGQFALLVAPEFGQELVDGFSELVDLDSRQRCLSDRVLGSSVATPAIL